MSDNEYEEDFDDYDEDFESDNELEVPDQPQQTTTIADVAYDAWPSLTAAAAVKQKPRAATFARSLITGGTTQPAAADGISYFISPAPPPLTDTQRSRASKTLNRSLQQQQQVKLSLSPVYELLLLQPMSSYQQLALGVGAYAGRVAAASQTRQMDQELHEQDVQTEEVEVQDGSCQVPDAALSSSNSSSRIFNRSISTAAAAAAASNTATTAATKLLDSDAVAEFLEWAVPEAIFELSKAAAAAAAAAEQAGSRAAGARQGLPFAPSTVSQTALNSSGSRTSSTRVSRSQPQLIAGQLLLDCSSLLSGRTVLAVACPSNAVAAAATAAAIGAATAAAAISSHLLLCCCSPVAMSAEAALREHGLPGLGCLCIWDLLQRQQQGAAAGGRSNGGGSLVQLLVTEGRPTCCCWGAGAGCSLVFAGMGEGGVCCWDLSEPDSTHTQQQQQQQSSRFAPQQQQQWPTPRRPSYTSQVPLTMLEDMFNNRAGSSSSSSVAFDAAVSSRADSIVAVAAVAPAAGNASAGAAAAAGGAVCQLITLSSSCNVELYSVMMGGAGGAAAAAGGTDLGMRSGSRVWLVKLLGGLPLGVEAAKPPHLRSPPSAAAAAAAMQATSLLHLPGANQQILVGTSSSCILRGACLGSPPPPRHYIAATWELLGFGAQSPGPGLNPNTLGKTPDSSEHSHPVVAGSDQSFDSSVSSSICLGSVESLSVCRIVHEAWLAGFGSGGVALFSVKKSRPVLMWQQLRPARVVAARWIPTRPCVFVVLFADGQLLAFDLSQDTKHPLVIANLQRPAAAAATNSNHSSNAALPCSMEVLVHSSSSTSAAAPAANNSRDLRFRTSGKGSRRGTAEAQGASGAAAASVAAQCSIAVGYDDGVTVVYQLGSEWSSSQQQEDEERLLQQLLAS